MPLDQDADIQRMLDDCGVSVTVGATTAKCLVSDSDEQIASESSSVLIGRAIILDCKRGTFAGLAQGAALTADYPAAATSYKVVSVRRKESKEQRISIVCAKV